MITDQYCFDLIYYVKTLLCRMGGKPDDTLDGKSDGTLDDKLDGASCGSYQH